MTAASKLTIDLLGVYKVSWNVTDINHINRSLSLEFMNEITEQMWENV